MKTLILAGGSGTRLFPLSREQFPKQFIKLFNGESLFQKTVKRQLLLSAASDITIITNRDHKFLIRDQLAEIGCDCPVLTEPVGKNTLPAIYYGVMMLAESGADTSDDRIAVVSSDHLIEPDDAFLAAFKAAERLADRYLVVFGIRPTAPHTGYGYIRPGSLLGDDGYLVDCFVEKPDQETAEEYCALGYLWNSGMFVFSPSLFLSEAEKYAGEIVAAFSNLSVEEAYAKVPKISIDYGIMERTDRAAVVPFSSGWNDLGTFDALYDTFPKNEDANAIRGEHIGINSEKNLIIGNRLIATVGVSNLAIIETKDAILVASRDQAQRIGEIAKELKEQGDERAIHHMEVHRPWGSYTMLEGGDAYRIKRVSVPPGRRLSLQMHHHRSEHWIVVRGTAEVTIGEERYLLTNGQSTYVPAGTVHRLANPGLLPLELIEVQIGEYTGEDDIVRIEDDYRRV
ncbi:mannose-1-phosphate guanylyltransferase/mannose-6-phosphate isomerase [Methanocalculus alkaliphilus]|uniref:mannose-1-phosphate guanylyltransferase/mannose-6-phosphate isomerase n=1 Tax=Methanocalculus alkaliphilus TaxID=768730 RepID=UPI00209D2010|nr:mannose-1-phosphate guanylyltransferase/mannose-6-phosphate isomerase [Methanocalculus alkaliphilus]MCP1714722.1 mannose-1-phosphate guanylyltransferase/mannose-6-phosphate isomerase [Methanocalculus alkaliphilus]